MVAYSINLEKRNNFRTIYRILGEKVIYLLVPISMNSSHLIALYKIFRLFLNVDDTQHEPINHCI